MEQRVLGLLLRGKYVIGCCFNLAVLAVNGRRKHSVTSTVILILRLISANCGIALLKF
jgi:hypothetical protein